MRYYTPEERFEINEMAKTSPAYQLLAQHDRLSWRIAHPIASMFSEPPMEKPADWDERVAREKQELRDHLNLMLSYDLGEPAASELREKLRGLDATFVPRRRRDVPEGRL